MMVGRGDAPLSENHDFTATEHLVNSEHNFRTTSGNWVGWGRLVRPLIWAQL